MSHFAGDPTILPYGDNEIRQGADAFVQTFDQVFSISLSARFSLRELFYGADRVIGNSLEDRTVIENGRSFTLPISILTTAERTDTGAIVNSLQSIYDSTVPSTAVLSSDPFPVSAGEKPSVRIQGGNEFLNLTGFDNQVQVDLTIFSEAAYDNSIGVYKVDDITGAIGDLNPGDANYAKAAFAATVLGFDRTQSNLSKVLKENDILAFYVIANGTTAEFLAENPENLSTGPVNAYFTFVGANPDGFDHFRLAGSTIFVEDLFGGGDQDFNDMQFAISTLTLPATSTLTL